MARPDDTPSSRLLEWCEANGYTDLHLALDCSRTHWRAFPPAGVMSIEIPQQVLHEMQFPRSLGTPLPMFWQKHLLIADRATRFCSGWLTAPRNRLLRLYGEPDGWDMLVRELRCSCWASNPDGHCPDCGDTGFISIPKPALRWWIGSHLYLDRVGFQPEGAQRHTISTRWMAETYCRTRGTPIMSESELQCLSASAGFRSTLLILARFAPKTLLNLLIFIARQKVGAHPLIRPWRELWQKLQRQQPQQPLF